MTRAVVDLLPRYAELARRAAGGDGAAFVRLYDRYSTEVFATALAATGSVDAGAEATQTAFLRVLRWPPALGAPDDDVVELLYALALGGPHEWTAPSPQETDLRVARLVGVGWLRSETVAKAGARYDADWSVHLWSPPAPAPADALPPLPALPALPEEPVVAPSRRRLPSLPRLRLPIPSPAAAAAVLLVFLAGATGTLLLDGTAGSNTDSASAAGEVQQQRERAEVRPLGKQQRQRRAEAGILRQKTLRPLLAP
jgi:hypothetical protein